MKVNLELSTKVFLFSLSLVLFSCSEPKIIRKRVNHGDVSVTWYYHSFISNHSPDIIEIKKGDAVVKVYKSPFGVYDFEVDKNVLVIYTLPNTSSEMEYDKILGYNVVLDTLGKEFKGWDKVPLGNKEVE